MDAYNDTLLHTAPVPSSWSRHIGFQGLQERQAQEILNVRALPRATMEPGASSVQLGSGRQPMLEGPWKWCWGHLLCFPTMPLQRQTPAFIKCLDIAPSPRPRSPWQGSKFIIVCVWSNFYLYGHPCLHLYNGHNRFPQPHVVWNGHWNSIKPLYTSYTFSLSKTY